jgi:uncharacterized protein YeaC (DUF1315 family)
LFVFSTRTAIIGIWIDGNATTWEEYASDLDILGIHQADKVLHDDVDTVLVKGTMVAETKKVELETLAFNHLDVGDVADAYLGKVGLPSDRAETCKLGTVELYPIIVLGVFVIEGFKHLGSIILAILCGVAKQS